YVCIRSHTASNLFETAFWNQVVKPSLISNQSVVWYTSEASNQIVNVPYGTQFSSLQNVCDFLNGLQRYYISRGWIFDQILNNDYISDWARSCYEFMAWFHDNQQTPGTFIALSPGSTAIHFNTDQGEPQSVEQCING